MARRGAPGWLIAALVLGSVGPAAAQQRDSRAALFVRHTCTECHAVSALGLRAVTDVGPDLTFAYADVVNRYGTTLEFFLGHPTGIMRMILMSHVELTAGARDSIIHVLKALFEERRAEMDEEIPSTPPGRSKTTPPPAPTPPPGA